MPDKEAWPLFDKIAVFNLTLLSGRLVCRRFICYCNDIEIEMYLTSSHPEVISVLGRVIFSFLSLEGTVVAIPLRNRLFCH